MKKTMIAALGCVVVLSAIVIANVSSTTKKTSLLLNNVEALTWGEGRGMKAIEETKRLTVQPHGIRGKLSLGVVGAIQDVILAFVVPTQGAKIVQLWVWEL